MVQVAQSQESLAGQVERVTFHGGESGFCVLRTKVKGHRDDVTVVGQVASITVGEYIVCEGVWINDSKHGLQFKAKHIDAQAPSTLEGMEKYLGSGMVKGIGPHFAKKLVQAYGAKVFDVIESEPKQLLLLEGLGKKRVACITQAWSEQKSIRQIMVFLQSHGVGTARAVAIYKMYGDHAIDKVKKNPYNLALDIFGIGFKTADQLAERLGIAQDAPMRAQAGVRHVLHTLCDKGHCAAPKLQLISACQALLEIDAVIIEAGLEHELVADHLVQDTIDDQLCIYPMTLYLAEKNAAQQVRRLCQGPLPWGCIDMTRAIQWAEEKTKLSLSDSQHEALQTIFKHKMAIITGGPGVGKTTLVGLVITILQAKSQRIGVCAPTGRAAKRLQESTGLPAKTIHRMLDYAPGQHGFRHHADNPLQLDVLIVDESSMIDIALLNHLLKAVPSHAAVIFVGDIHQLPSVGSGAVLSDLIESGCIQTVRLTEVFRQAKHSKIIVNAHRINQGQMPAPNQGQDSDFFMRYVESPEALLEQLMTMVCERLPAYYRCNPVQAIQVLTPMNRGALGARSLNIELQKRLNGASEPKIKRSGTTFAPGDKIIQMVNNYDKEVFNGDIGCIEAIDIEASQLTISFDGHAKVYEFHELEQVALAYAISIHKSQGSEFPMVVIPLAMQHYTLLARNLLYTAVTRGKQLVVVVGQKKAVAMAVHNNQDTRRITKLSARVQG